MQFLSGGEPDGLTQWEVTTAELLSAQGYATGIWGKWHLGSAEDRMPTNQGFDEWYGIPRTYDEAMWPSLNETKSMWPSVGNKQGWDAKVVHPQHIYDARKGEKPRQVAVLDVDRRRTMDAGNRQPCGGIHQAQCGRRQAVLRLRPVRAGSHADTSKSGVRRQDRQRDWWIAWPRWIIAPVKFSTLSRKQVSKTICSSYSPVTTGRRQPTPGDNGPWRGTYFTAMEGSLRAPFIIRWPGKVPAGRVSNEIVHIVDLFTTLAHVGGAEVPKDRPIDGVDQLEFFLGRKETSNRGAFSLPTSPIASLPSNGETGKCI